MRAKRAGKRITAPRPPVPGPEPSLLKPELPPVTINGLPEAQFWREQYQALCQQILVSGRYKLFTGEWPSLSQH
jgi:hypothetical protein